MPIASLLKMSWLITFFDIFLHKEQGYTLAFKYQFWRHKYIYGVCYDHSPTCVYKLDRGNADWLRTIQRNRNPK